MAVTACTATAVLGGVRLSPVFSVSRYPSPSFVVPRRPIAFSGVNLSGIGFSLIWILGFCLLDLSCCLMVCLGFEVLLFVFCLIGLRKLVGEVKARKCVDKFD